MNELSRSSEVIVSRVKRLAQNFRLRCVPKLPQWYKRDLQSRNTFIGWLLNDTATPKENETYEEWGKRCQKNYQKIIAVAMQLYIDIENDDVNLINLNDKKAKKNERRNSGWWKR